MCTGTNQRPGAVSSETVYGLTSRAPDQADAARILDQVHTQWVRDVTYDEESRLIHDPGNAATAVAESGVACPPTSFLLNQPEAPTIIL